MFKLCLVRPTSQYFLSLDQQKHQFICIRLYFLHEKLSFLIEDCINSSWFHINCVQIYDILWNAAAGIHFAPGEIVEIAMTFLFGVSHLNYNQTLSELSTSPLCWRRVKKTKKKKSVFEMSEVSSVWRKEYNCCGLWWNWEHSGILWTITRQES